LFDGTNIVALFDIPKSFPINSSKFFQTGYWGRLMGDFILPTLVPFIPDEHSVLVESLNLGSPVISFSRNTVD
jgi:hypothetical protein